MKVRIYVGKSTFTKIVRIMNYLRSLLEDPRGTGADRQIALYQETGSIDAVIQFLMQQTMQDIALAVA